MLFDSRARATAHGDVSLPLIRRFSDVQDLIDYLDQVFSTIASEHSVVGEPYPTIAWSANRVAVEQSDVEVGRPLLPVRYLERPMQLSPLRASSDGPDALISQLQRYATVQRDATASFQSEAQHTRRILSALASSVAGVHDRLSRGVYVPDADYSGIPRRLQFPPARTSDDFEDAGVETETETDLMDEGESVREG